MKQQTLAVAADQNAVYEQYRKPTRRDAFLATMEQIVPAVVLCTDTPGMLLKVRSAGRGS